MKLNRSSKLVVALVVTALLVVTNIGSGVQAGPLPQAGATMAATIASPVGAPVPESATAKCTPVEVAVYTNSPRIHVKCSSPSENIQYFAVGTTDAALAQRVLTVLTAALTTGKGLAIVYDPSDVSGAQIGCLGKDCRLIITVSILK